MDEQAGSLDTTRLGGELDAALTALETVLSEASRAVAGIRGTLPQIAALGQVVGELEAAMSNARRYLGVDADADAEPEAPAAIADAPAPAPQAEAIAPPPAEPPVPEPAIATKDIEPEVAVPAVAAPSPAASLAESAAEAAAPSEPEPAPVAEVTPFAPVLPQPAAPEPAAGEWPSAPAEAEPAAPEPSTVEWPSAQPEAGPAALDTAPVEPADAPVAAELGATGPTSYNLQLRVSTTSGSLDLKAVDRSVNENPGVVDVTLLDYDGRKATLKVWIDPDADPRAVQEGLLTSLKQHLAQGQEANIIIDVDGEAAA